MGAYCSRQLPGTDVLPAFPVYTEDNPWLLNMSEIPWNHNTTDGMPGMCWPREPWGGCDVDGSVWLLTTTAPIASAISNLFISAAGLIGLLASDYSDEILDLASSITVVNGIGGCLAHATELRVFEELDLVSMLISGLLFFKGMARALFPVLNSKQYLRTFMNMMLVIVMFCTACWTSFNIPPDIYNYSELSRYWPRNLVT